MFNGSVAAKAKNLDLVGLAEVAELLGMRRAAVCELRRQPQMLRRRPYWRPVFPEPVAELRCGPIWLRSQIERYLKELNLPHRERVDRYFKEKYGFTLP